MLSRENSASPGRFRTDVVPYLREVMDTCTDRRIRETVVMKGVQVAFTDGVVNNLVGYHIHQDPAPILVVHISVEEAEKWSKEKLSPMLRDTPVLRASIKDARTRNSDTTILSKAYPGGHLGIVGANAPAGLRARPRRVVIFDEIDGFPPSSGKEGNPIKLGEKRATTFWNRKLIKGSTPTLKKFSNIEREYERSDQRRWHCPCPHCGAEQVLVWKGVQWEKTGEGDTKVHKPETAYYVCQPNGCVITESARQRMIRAGRWLAMAPPGVGETKPAGFHIPALISPFVSLAELADEFVAAKGERDLLQVFVNTRLAETFEEKGERVNGDTLYDRREEYQAEVPMGAALLVVSVDVQGDRLEVAVKGYGEQEESWLIHLERLLGDPGDAAAPDNVWARLDALLEREWIHESGVLLRATVTVIDYGGHYSDNVARFVRAHAGRQVYAIRGAKEQGKPLWPTKPARVGKHRVKVYEVGPDTAKDLILGSRLRKPLPGPGYMHFPVAPWCDAEYFAQLTSEQKIARRDPQGGWSRRWVPTRDRNEALDLEVYALAALHSLGETAIKGLGRRAEKLREQGAALRATKPVAPPPEPASVYSPPKPRRAGWVNNW
jgi:phage terminase large subunit GpA-like protein